MDARWKRQLKLTHTAIVWLVVGVGLIAITAAAWSVVAKLSEEKLYLAVGSGSYRVSVARTAKEQEQGLAGVKKLGDSEGMLFVFDRSNDWPIWMKGMRIPIDIVWIDEDKRVVHVERKVQPDAVPYVVYKPPKPARYVLELPSGASIRDKVSTGDLVMFELEDIKE